MIYVIFGPTGSGKTDVAVKLSDYFNAPIINADAFQIYKEMNIGTNKISKDDEHYKKHYLLDILTPDQEYSVKQYQEDFRKTLSELKDYKNIIVCGGTGLYIKAALFDYVFKQENTPINEYEDKSNEELYKMLQELDYEASTKIHINNRKRVIRAINLINNSGEKKSDIINAQEHKLIYKDVEFIFLNPDRENLYSNINKRVDDMFDAGLVEEVRNISTKYNLSQTARQGIGYKEVLQYLNNEISLEECKELIKKRTRNYAKRQVTFFKNQFKFREFHCKNDIFKEFFYE